MVLAFASSRQQVFVYAPLICKPHQITNRKHAFCVAKPCILRAKTMGFAGQNAGFCKTSPILSEVKINRK